MARQPIQLGTAPTGAGGDTARQAFTRVNEMTAELYATQDSQATKLAGIAEGATANAADSFLLDRENHTGQQAIGTVSGLQSELDNREFELSTDTGLSIDRTNPLAPVIGASGNLLSLAQLTGAADRLPYFTGAGPMSVTALTAKARELLGATNEAAMRTFLQLGNAAQLTAQTGVLDTTALRLLIQGAFGLGNAATGPAITDFMTHNPTGFYRCTSTAANIPPGLSTNSNIIALRLSATGTAYFVQQAFSAGTQRAWTGYYNGTTIVWVELWHSGNFNPALYATIASLGTAAAATLTTSNTDGTAGRVLKGGDLGIGGTVNPTWPNASLNNCTGCPPGGYKTDATVTAGLPQAGTGTVYFGITLAASFRFTQLFISDTTGIAYIRGSNGGTLAAPTWGSWRTVPDGTDTGWQAITLTNSWTIFGGRTPYVRKIGNQILFIGAITNDFANNNTSFCTLSATFRGPARAIARGALAGPFLAAEGSTYCTDLSTGQILAWDRFATSGPVSVALDALTYTTD